MSHSIYFRYMVLIGPTRFLPSGICSKTKELQVYFKKWVWMTRLRLYKLNKHNIIFKSCYTLLGKLNN